MQSFNCHKYKQVTNVAIQNRSWPNCVIEKAPRWVSVDLRDGNQALLEPMDIQKKKKMWGLLIKLGFKEIEVGFPSASQSDYDFIRWLIDEDKIPADVSIQVLMQAREALIVRSFEALRGVHRAIIHLYNSTSQVQRERVFKLDKPGIIAIACRGAKWVKREANRYPQSEWIFEYSPESFSNTEVDYAVEICDAVLNVWQADSQVEPQQACIINLPSTVESTTPNIFADQVEYFSNHLSRRDQIVLSVHTHNDRGGAVASAELAVLAGAERVEGTLFGNGERTGNMDIITMAMNLYSQGINPELDFSQPDEMIQVYKACTGLDIHPRHPWVGELVYTAFSGSHQDAIRKCLHIQMEGEPWQVAYLPIDPRDIGRDYQAIIRVNSQSGKGGIAFVLERDYGIILPRWMQVEMAQVVQRESEQCGSEIDSTHIYQLFQKHFMANACEIKLQSFQLDRQGENHKINMTLIEKGNHVRLHGCGEGGLAAFVHAWQKHTGQSIHMTHYDEHAIASGTDAQAIAFVQLKINGQRFTGVAIDADSIAVTFKAVLSAICRSYT